MFRYHESNVCFKLVTKGTARNNSKEHFDGQQAMERRDSSATKSLRILRSAASTLILRQNPNEKASRLACGVFVPVSLCSSVH